MKSKICEDMVGAKFSDMIFQPTANILSTENMFVINFVKNKKLYSLHVFCSIRVLCSNQILLTSADEFVGRDYQLLNASNDVAESLVGYNISKIKQLSQHTIITKIELRDCGDLIIVLSNDVIIEVRPDCLLDMFEHFRLFEYKNYANIIIVLNKNQNVCIEQ